MDKVTQRLDVIGLNQRELQLFTGSPVVELTEEHRREMYATMRPGVVVLARQGARGCRLGSLEGGRVDLPAYTEVDVVNTTGAGDTHTGVFLAELWRGAGLEEAAAVATVAASLSVARDASAGGPSREELDAALARMGRTSEGSAG